ncbi:Os02g0537600 [Oryza sativa Japonica Group]|uniref:Os02g0537600 protein n=1 Tax=Oryza sativa subsp. japonica TaxID=39947 RepID=A0A0P0VK68_ORYSJ|nr:Os02g0537600 [Oryza sativa Japonica Group]
MAAATGSGPDDAGACADGRKDDAAVRQLRRYSVTTAPNEANTAVADGCPDLGDGSLQTTALRTRPSMETMEVRRPTPKRGSAPSSPSSLLPRRHHCTLCHCSHPWRQVRGRGDAR